MNALILIIIASLLILVGVGIIIHMLEKILIILERLDQARLDKREEENRRKVAGL